MDGEGWLSGFVDGWMEGFRIRRGEFNAEWKIQ